MWLINLKVFSELQQSKIGFNGNERTTIRLIMRGRQKGQITYSAAKENFLNDFEKR